MGINVGLTAAEMKYEAQIIYEGMASADAPGYDDKQWSVLLTQAQEKIIRKLLTNGLDRDEFSRRAISSLIKHNETITFQIGPDSYPNSWSVIFPDTPEFKIMAIIGDFVNAIGGSPPVEIKGIKVKPITYDYYWSNIDNPYRKPNHANDSYYWKLELMNDDLNIASPLVITDGYTPSKYMFDYIERPTPIIITALTDGTTIDGELNQMDCQLNHTLHREIVKEAATLAYAYLQEQVGYQMQKMEDKN